jgi:hypothetical protein
MRTDPLIDRLVEDLKPVRRRTVWGDAFALLVLCAVELGLFLALGMMRSEHADGDPHAFILVEVC